MTAAHIHILTTEGPVLIQRIAEEDPGIRSVVCVDGRAEALPISPAYDAFVRRPTGVIERFTGHGAYRMDVASAVTEGQSWQLAVYLAHVAALKGAATPAVYATGEVDHDGAVRPVAYVERKLKTIGPLDPDAVILVPADAVPDIDTVEGVRLVRVATVDEALAAVGLEPPAVPVAAASLARPAHRPRTARFRSVALALAGAVLLFWLGFQPAQWAGMASEGRLLDLETALDAADGVGRVQAGLFRTYMSARRPDPNGVRVEAAILAAPTGAACGEAAKAFSPGDALAAGETVCRAEVRAFAGNEGGVVVGRLAYWPDGLGVGRAARILRGSAEPGGRFWQIDFAGNPPPGAVLRLALIAGPADVSGAQPWYSDLLSTAQGGAALEATVQRLVRLGYAASVYDWRIR